MSDITTFLASKDDATIQQALTTDQILFSIIGSGNIADVEAILRKAKDLELLSDVLDKPHIFTEKTVLQCACEVGNVRIVQLLIDADSNRLLRDGFTDLYAFTLAFDLKHHGVCEIILKYPFPNTCLHNDYGFVRPFLHAACTRNDMDFVRLLLRYGPSSEINRRSPAFSDLTPVGIACEQGNVDIVNLLLDRGGNVDQNTLRLASSGGNKRLIRSLLEFGNVNPKTLGYLPKHEASTLCVLLPELGYSMVWEHWFIDFEKLTELDAIFAHKQSITAIINCLVNYSSSDNPLKDFHLYLEYGLDPDELALGYISNFSSSYSSFTNMGINIFMTMLDIGHFESVKLTRHYFFTRSLLLTCQYKQFDLASKLAEFGARFEMTDYIDSVLRYGGEGVIDVLMQSSGFDVNAVKTGSEADSMLMLACGNLLPLTVEKLIQGGANVNYGYVIGHGYNTGGEQTALLRLAQNIRRHAAGNPTAEDSAKRILDLFKAAGIALNSSSIRNIATTFTKQVYPGLAAELHVPAQTSSGDARAVEERRPATEGRFAKLTNFFKK